MNKKLEKRILKEAKYIIDKKTTVRNTAQVFKVSKSTVHKDMQERLYNLDKTLHKKIDKIFKEHIEIRHIRGGESTKQKYLKIKEG